MLVSLIALTLAASSSVLAQGTVEIKDCTLDKDAYYAAYKTEVDAHWQSQASSIFRPPSALLNSVEHFRRVGSFGNFSPCGNLMPKCKFSAAAFRKLNQDRTKVHPSYVHETQTNESVRMYAVLWGVHKPLLNFCQQNITSTY